MATLLLFILPLVTAAGSAYLVWFMMRCRMEEAVARERSGLAELQSALVVQRETLESAIYDAKAAAKRAAFDDFLNDFRVEQRQFVRKTRGLFVSKHVLVLRERILFRNLPLSNWIEQTTTLDETVSVPTLNSGVTVEAILES
ncbi:MAG TPA: hypothetical protein VMI94_26750 [Bryobacteraceae bacterium]|nr:hypothetical protein [Bryobacteraceae bacterium]